MDWDRLVERALVEAERAGIGRGARAPGWMRARARAALEDIARTRGTDPSTVASSLRADRGVLEVFARALRVGETRFLREPSFWRALEAEVLPARPAKRVGILSAGCSTGEEAYTAAMLLEALGRPGSVLGVDADRAALAHAQAGRYDEQERRHLSAAWASRYLRPSDRPGEIAIEPAVASRVTFEHLDVCRRAPRGSFDVVLFKNVLVYLSPEAADAALHHLARALAPDGLLFVAASEVATCRRHPALAAVRLAGGLTAFQRAAVRADD